MLWSKKEEKRTLPDLPPLQRPGLGNKLLNREIVLPHEHEIDEEEQPQKQEFPSFPDSLGEKGFSQAAIKDAVENDSNEENNFSGGVPEGMSQQQMKYLPSNSDKSFKTVEMEEWTPSMGSGTTDDEAQGFLPNSGVKLGEPPAINFKRSEIQKIPKSVDIFVKLDKFYSARKALIEAQQKMIDIDELLKKIRETKMREEHELNTWEKELMNIKARMNDITVNLFEKIE